MAQVSDKVLSWLYTVLHEYNDPQRTYSDAARALSDHPSLQTRTETYTYETGSSALLLILHGTLPVTFRGTTYRFPVKILVPHAYPYEAPIAYVAPTKDMVVRPGQHVGVDGRIYHPYLRDWAHVWDRASIAEFVNLLRQIFAKEPPVISRAQQQQYQQPFRHGQQQMAGASQTPPQLPPKPGMQSLGPTSISPASAAPPVPPKPGEEYAETARDHVRDGPPLPPLPHEAMHTKPQSPFSHVAQSQWRTSWSPQPSVSTLPDHQNGRSLVPSPLHQQVMQQQKFQPISDHDRSPVSPVSLSNGYSELPESKYLQPPLQSQPRPPQASFNSPYSPRPQIQHQQVYQQPSPQPLHSQGYQHPQSYSQQRGVPSSHAAPDLLTDPFDVALPGPIELQRSAPPIPPNPEKEHLLHAISGALTQQAQQKVNQNLAAIQPLQAQHHALRAAHERLEVEIRQLDQLEQVLSSNEAILHRGIQECDHTIAAAKSKKQPPIDEVLIAPTMVANQLWNLCAEEAACREAMYVLQKAVDRGRVSGNDFARHMRGLGRECFLKMALARKCARGMGLEMR